MRTHLVRLVLEVEVNEFNSTEAVQRALAIANGDIMTYLVGLEAGLLDDEEDQCE
jgi:non-canonical (house-cleaning) NTP pyrophosphatase